MRSELAGEPELRADLSVAVAGVYVNLGLPGSARPLLEEALEIRREIHGPDSEPAAAAARQLARVLTLEGNGEAPMRSLRLRSPIIFRSTIPL